MKRMIAGIVLVLAYITWIVWLFSLEFEYHNARWVIHNVQYSVLVPEMLAVFALSGWLIWSGVKAVKKSRVVK